MGRTETMILITLLIIDIAVKVIQGIKSTKLEKRLVKVGSQVIKQNELLEKKCELLETIFNKQYEEVKKKYEIKEK